MKKFCQNVNAKSEDSETVMDNTESILDVSKRGFGRTTLLNWHYRSRHESLITFSNRQFYDDELVVFPSPKGKHDELGIVHHYVDGGKYYKGKNVTEAEVVANAALTRLTRFPDKSLGIGTFNIEQKELIRIK